MIAVFLNDRCYDLYQALTGFLDHRASARFVVEALLDAFGLGGFLHAVLGILGDICYHFV